MDQLIDELKKNLIKRHFDVSVFETGDEAVAYLKEQIQNTTVGIGGSMTVQQLNLFDVLSETNEVSWHWRIPEGMNTVEVRKKENTADHYICSVNGAAATGELINIDGTGNRIADENWGHSKVWLIVGKNKIAPDFEKALWRARNVAAPKNARRLHRKTPCAVKGDRCYDCASPERICNSLSVLWNKPYSQDYEVVIVDEDLGY